jgi:hypothetical protein
VLEAEIELLDAQKAGERARLEDDANKAIGAEARLTALVVLREFETKENDRRAGEDRDEAERQRDAALEAIEDKEKEKEKVEEINRLYRDRLDIINQIHLNNQEQIEQGAKPGIDNAQRDASGGVFGALSDIFQSAGGEDVTRGIQNQADILKAVYGDLATTSKAAIGSMVQGLGQLLSTWISTGKFSAKAALQMVSGIATGLAIEAGLKALMQYAEGLALAANPFTAALAPGHFAAASAYGIAAAAAGAVGLGTGLAARAFGGSTGGSAGSKSFERQTSSGAATGVDPNRTGGGSGEGGSAYSGSTGEARIQEDLRNRAPQQVVQRHELTLRVPSGWAASAFVEDFNNRGSVHGLITKVVEG